jgi:hypothetical protein
VSQRNWVIKESRRLGGAADQNLALIAIRLSTPRRSFADQAITDEIDVFQGGPGGRFFERKSPPVILEKDFFFSRFLLDAPASLAAVRVFFVSIAMVI